MGAIHTVQVQRDGVWTDVVDKQEVEQAIKVTLVKRFTLTNGTILQHDQWKHEFGLFGEQDAVSQVLQGTYVLPEDTPPAVARILNEISAVAKIMKGRGIDLTFSTEEYIRYWRKAKEKTSSSISGLHFGHWKTLAKCPWLAEQQAKLTKAAFQAGSPYKHWMHGLTVMLEWIAHCVHVDKLRAILLIETDFNFANKLVFGKKMVDNMEEAGVIPPEAIGSCKDMQW